MGESQLGRGAAPPGLECRVATWLRHVEKGRSLDLCLKVRETLRVPKEGIVSQKENWAIGVERSVSSARACGGGNVALFAWGS